MIYVLLGETRFTFARKLFKQGGRFLYDNTKQKPVLPITYKTGDKEGARTFKTMESWRASTTKRYFTTWPR